MPKHICKRCGECCLSPALSDEDIEKILKLGYKKEFFVVNITGKSYMQTDGEYCVFLERLQDGKTSCKIYPSRPKICQLYPSDNFDNCQPEKSAFDDYLKKKNEQNREDYKGP